MESKLKNTPQHAPMDQFPNDNGILQLGGIPVTMLAERAGQTPFYAYDRQQITRRVQELRNTLPESIQIHYALKANPMPAVVQHMRGLVDGFDVASGGELRTALDSGMPATQISMAGPGKTDAELRQAIATGATLNLESANEMRRAQSIAEEMGVTARVAIRVNPDFVVKSSGMKMGGGAKPFGIDADQVPALLKDVGTTTLELTGLHIYWGSQSLNSQAIMEAHNKTFELALRLSEAGPCELQTLNIGGGLGIPYFPGETRLDLSPIAENLEQLVRGFKQKHPTTQIVMELGRYLVGEAGVYICKVIDIKESAGEKFIIVDGGLHHHLAASGNFGQVIRKNYPVAIATKMRATDTERASVAGPLCTPLDLLADKMELAKAEIGDLVAIFQSGAYGASASPERFLGHPTAVEMLV